MTPVVPDLRDEVVVLRPPNEADIDAITVAVQDPDIPRFTRIPSPYSRVDAVAFVERAQEGWRSGTSRSLMICDARHTTLLGGVGLHSGAHPQVLEIGYWVDASARRRGIATRAVRLLSTWAITHLELQRLELMTHVDNVASQGVAARAGFTREGVLRSYATIGCGLADVVMFSLLPGEIT
jgi:RimJ/RimL family protein N-acetyltransferase